MRPGLATLLALLLCSAAAAKPKKARCGMFADYIETEAPADPPRPALKAPDPAPQSQDAHPAFVIFVVDRTVDDLDAVKKLVPAAMGSLAPTDYVAVVAFDSDAQVYVRPTRVSNRERIATDVARLQAGHATNVFAGLMSAFELGVGFNTPTKAVVLLTDGRVSEEGLAELLEDMHLGTQRVIVVGTRGGERLPLVHIADWGHGKLVMLDDEPGERALFDEVRAIQRLSRASRPARR